MKFKFCNKKTIKLIELLIEKIQNSEINDSINFAYYLGEILFYNQIPFFDISDIEEKLIEETYPYIKNSSTFNVENNGFLFVVTEPYITGGHTRLMENLSLMIDGHKELIVTKSMDREIKNRLSNFFPEIIECYRNKYENPINHINKLVGNFLKYNFIILNIHPEDIFSVIASAIAKKIKKELKIYFVNHSDHTFTYGTSVADFWFEISLYGKKIDNLRNIKGKRTFLGIPINKSDESFSQKSSYSSLSYATNFITAGSAIKYKPFQNYSVLPCISDLLKFNRDFSANVIGVDLIRNYWWWLLKLNFFNRLKLYKSLPYEKYIEVTQKADCYIDSHPMPGGTAFVEQFLNGIPCIGLRSFFFGYTPLEKVKKENIAEIIEMIQNPPSDKEIKEIQELVFDVHGFSKVKNRFRSTIEESSTFENPMLYYIGNQELIFFEERTVYSIIISFVKILFKSGKISYLKLVLLLIFNELIESRNLFKYKFFRQEN